MAAPKDDGPTKTSPPREDKTTEPAASTAHITADSRVEGVAQHIDEYDPETAMRMMVAHLRMADDVRRNGGGRWEMPPTHRQIQPNGAGRTHRITRLGCMADVRQRDKILRQRFLLEQQGWRLAPQGTRNSLFIVDGDQGVYMILPESVGRIADEHERQTRAKIHQRRFSRSVNNLPEDLAAVGLRGVSFDRVDVSSGQTSIEGFRAMK